MMKLYLSQIDSYLKESENTVLECNQLEEGLYGLILDDSCLYPEGGGQPWDLGYIDNNEVLRVEIVSNGLQVVIKQSYPIGSKVISKVDWNRRYDFMQQHTCQHLLSASVHSLYGAETVKWELGRTNVAVDFARNNEFTSQEIENIEECVNNNIRNGRIISWSVNRRESLDTLELLRGLPKGVASELEQLRIITIDGYDSNPCGGTHLASTSEIQIFKIISQEIDRKNVRLRFICGNRVLKSLSSLLYLENKLSTSLCIQTSEILSTVNLLSQEKKDLNKLLKMTQDELTHYYSYYLIQRWLNIPNNPRQYIIQHCPGANLSFLQAVGEIILQYSTQHNLNIKAIYLSGTTENLTQLIPDTNSNSSGNSGGNNKKKAAKNIASFIITEPTNEFHLTIPSSSQSNGPFIFYSTNVDQLKENISNILQGKCGGRPGKLQGQGNSLQNITTLDELLLQTFNINSNQELKELST